jgi:hypothetical protein
LLSRCFTEAHLSMDVESDKSTRPTDSIVHISR